MENGDETLLKAINDKLGELNDRFGELERSMRDFRQDISNDIGSLKESVNKIETRNLWSDTAGRGGVPYRPDSTSYAPSGRNLVEPESNWISEHPYRR